MSTALLYNFLEKQSPGVQVHPLAPVWGRP